MKSTKLLIVISLFSLLISCEVEESKPAETRIKRKLIFTYITDENPHTICEYFYNSKLRLEKITEGEYIYEEFYYNRNNQIMNKCTIGFCCDSLGWLKQDSTIYDYENGLLVKEEKYYFPSFSRIITTYKYENSLLVRKQQYYNQQIRGYILYDYTGNLCTMETQYEDTIKQRIVGYTEHSYESGKLTLSKVFSWNGLEYQEIYYTYNENGDLIIEESKQVSHEVTIFVAYVIRYEYY